MEDYKQSQIEINGQKDHLIHLEELNKELHIQLDHFEKQELEKNAKLTKVAQILQGDTIKNKEVLQSFIDNLNLLQQEKQLLSDYVSKMLNQIDLLTN